MLLTIVQSEHDKRFGGFRGFKLDQGEEKWYSEDKAFIFSLSNRSKHEILDKTKVYYNHASNKGEFAQFNDFVLYN
jgi:hypothetical protein